MADIFLKIVNMSISASWIVLVILLIRLLLKKAPKWITVLLWGIVAIRLICPFSIESVLSLIPSAETISPDIMMDKTPAINSGIPVINDIVNPVMGESFSPSPMQSANPLQILIPVLAIAWVAGIIIMLAYTIISYLRVKNKVKTAVLFRDNIFQSENVVSPFVLGIIKPRIYLPFNINEQDMEHVIAHEKAHISRKDHLWKPFGFLILTLHWFNPLMWVSYILLCRDIELACDEKVVKEFDNEQKADYSQALLTCSINRRMIAACPLAFGEIGVKKRVKSILNYKKPAFWVIIAAIIAVAVFAVCFLTDPVSAEPEKNVTPEFEITNELSDEQTPTKEKTPEQSNPAVTPPVDKGQNDKPKVEPNKEEWEKSLIYSDFNSNSAHYIAIQCIKGTASLKNNGDYTLDGENLDHLAWVNIGYDDYYDGLYLGISMSLYHLTSDDKFIGICNDMVTKSYDGSIVKNNANIANEYVSISINGAPVKIKSVVMGKGNGHQDYYFVLDTDIDKNNIKELTFNIGKTPEFYDFMALDPEPEWNFESSEEYEIAQYNYNRMYGYLDTGKWTFTKKEVYYAHIDSIQESNCYLSIYFKKGKNDFYSEKTREKLEKLGFQFREIDYLSISKAAFLDEKEDTYRGKKDRIEALKEAFKIALEDHNVALVDTRSNPSVD